jgi:uncharacterized membrane protein YozB (DUF420 family)
MAVEQEMFALRAAAVDKAASRSRERKFFLIAGILFPVLVIVGFSKNYYFRPFFPEMGAIYSDLVRFHGAVMTAWVLLFASQVWLISKRNVKLHMKLGFAGVGLAVLVLATGYVVSIEAVRRTAGQEFAGMSPLEFLAVPLTDLVLFIVFFGGAIAFRKKPAEHKRLMLLSALNFLPATAARFPVEALQGLGAIWFLGFPAFLTAFAIALDTWRQGKLNKVFLAGGLLLIAAFPGRLYIGGTTAWVAFAEWLTSQ